MRVVLHLRFLQYRRSIRRWLRGLIEDRSLVLLYSVAFGGGAAWAYTTLPSALSRIVQTSSYPIATAAVRTGLVLLAILIWMQLTRGIHHPPIYLARGDVPMLLAGPIDRRAVIALRLVRAYASAGLAFAVPMALLGPFLVRIWSGASPARLALVWLHLSIGWVSLIHWRWAVFHSERLKRIARVVRWIGYALAGAAALALLVAWGVGPRISPVSASEAILAAPAWTFPELGAWSLLILFASAIASWIAVWRSVPRANLDGLARFSLLVSESVALYQGDRAEELEQVAARMRGTKRRRRKDFGLRYRPGVKAIAGKAVTMVLRQSRLAFAFVALVFVAALFAFVNVPVLWAKALILSGIATSIARFPLASLQQDLRNWPFARQLPFTAAEWADGNAGPLWGWQTALGWAFASILFGRGIVSGAELPPLMLFLAAAGYLVSQQGILMVIAEVRSERFLRFAVHIGCLAAFAVLAGVVVLLRAAGLPPWTGWIAGSGAGVLLARAWRRLALRAVRILIARPWENAQSL